MTAPSKNTILIVVEISLYLLASFVVYLLLKKIGLIQSKPSTDEEKQAAKSPQQIKTDIVTANAFNPKYYLTKPVTSVLTEPEATDYASKIHKAFNPTELMLGFKMLASITNSPEVVIGIIQQLANKAQVSQIAAFYQQSYGTSLSEDIANHFTKTDAANIYTIANSLPDE
jgi:hypothetical protein